MQNLMLKETKSMAKDSQNDAKTDAQINEISMRCRNLRFLVFRKEYSVKIVFLHDQGDQNQTQINQKSVPKRG